MLVVVMLSSCCRHVKELKPYNKIKNPAKPCGTRVSYGADDEIRTRDPRLGKPMLYH